MFRFGYRLRYGAAFPCCSFVRSHRRSFTYVIIRIHAPHTVVAFHISLLRWWCYDFTHVYVTHVDCRLPFIYLFAVYRSPAYGTSLPTSVFPAILHYYRVLHPHHPTHHISLHVCLLLYHFRSFTLRALPFTPRWIWYTSHHRVYTFCDPHGGTTLPTFI